MASIALTSQASAHGGGLNSAGCHTNHSTGDFHCHRPQVKEPPRSSVCHVVKNQERCGYAESTCHNLVKKFGGYCKRSK